MSYSRPTSTSRTSEEVLVSSHLSTEEEVGGAPYWTTPRSIGVSQTWERTTSLFSLTRSDRTFRLTPSKRRFLPWTGTSQVILNPFLFTTPTKAQVCSTRRRQDTSPSVLALTTRTHAIVPGSQGPRHRRHPGRRRLPVRRSDETTDRQRPVHTRWHNTPSNHYCTDEPAG